MLKYYKWTVEDCTGCLRNSFLMSLLFDKVNFECIIRRVLSFKKYGNKVYNYLFLGLKNL